MVWNKFPKELQIVTKDSSQINVCDKQQIIIFTRKNITFPRFNRALVNYTMLRNTEKIKVTVFAS